MQLDSPEKVMKYLQNLYKDHNFRWKKSGMGYVGFCPEHNDERTPNLHILPNRNDENWHYYCFACNFAGPKTYNKTEHDIHTLLDHLSTKLEQFSNTFIDYFNIRIRGLGDEIGINDLIDTAKRMQVGAYTKEIYSQLEDENIKEKIKKYNLDDYDWLVFTYRDINGKPAYLKFRNISIPKVDPKWKEIGVRTIKLTDNNAPAFFNVNAIHSDKPVLFAVEGEFDAITTQIVTNKLYPTVALSGTSGFKPEMLYELAKVIKNKAILVVPDFDEAGQATLEKLIENENLSLNFLKKHKIYAIPASEKIRAKDLDELLKGKYEYFDDIMSDILENAVLLADLKRRKEEEKRKEQEEKIISLYPQDILKKLNIITRKQREQRFSIKQILSTDFGETKCTFDCIFHEGLNLIVSRGGAGKSFITLLIAIDYAFKQKRKALCIVYEDFLNEKFKNERIKEAIHYYAESQDIKKTEIENAVRDYIDVDFEYDSIFEKTLKNKIVETKYFSQFKKDIDEYGLIIADPFLSFVGVDELESSLIRRALLKIREVLIEKAKGTIVIFTHHTNKNLKVFSELSRKNTLTFEDYNALVEATRGSMETTNVVRNVVFLLGHPTIKNVRRLVVIKSNVSEIGKVKEVITPWALANEYEESISKVDVKNKKVKTYNFGGSVQ